MSAPAPSVAARKAVDRATNVIMCRSESADLIEELIALRNAAYEALAAFDAREAEIAALRARIPTAREVTAIDYAVRALTHKDDPDFFDSEAHHLRALADRQRGEPDAE